MKNTKQLLTYLLLPFLLIYSSCNHSDELKPNKQTLEDQAVMRHDGNRQFLEFDTRDLEADKTPNSVRISSDGNSAVVAAVPRRASVVDNTCSTSDLQSDPIPSFPYDDGQCRASLKWCGPDDFCGCTELTVTVAIWTSLNSGSQVWSQTVTMSPSDWVTFDLPQEGNLVIEFECTAGGDPGCEYRFYLADYGFNQGAWYTMSPSVGTPLYHVMATYEYAPYNNGNYDTWWYCQPYCTFQVPYYFDGSTSAFLQLRHQASGDQAAYFYMNNQGWSYDYFYPIVSDANVEYFVVHGNMNASNELCYSICYDNFGQQISVCPTQKMTLNSEPHILTTGGISNGGGTVICNGYTEISNNGYCP